MLESEGRPIKGSETLKRGVTGPLFTKFPQTVVLFTVHKNVVYRLSCILSTRYIHKIFVDTQNTYIKFWKRVEYIVNLLYKVYRYMYSYITLRTVLVNKPHNKLSSTPIYYQNYPALFNSLN